MIAEKESAWSWTTIVQTDRQSDRLYLFDKLAQGGFRGLCESLGRGGGTKQIGLLRLFHLLPQKIQPATPSQTSESGAFWPPFGHTLTTNPMSCPTASGCRGFFRPIVRGQVVFLAEMCVRGQATCALTASCCSAAVPGTICAFAAWPGTPSRSRRRLRGGLQRSRRPWERLGADRRNPRRATRCQRLAVGGEGTCAAVCGPKKWV